MDLVWRFYGIVWAFGNLLEIIVLRMSEYFKAKI